MSIESSCEKIFHKAAGVVDRGLLQALRGGVESYISQTKRLIIITVTAEIKETENLVILTGYGVNILNLFLLVRKKVKDGDLEDTEFYSGCVHIIVSSLALSSNTLTLHIWLP